MFSHSLIYINNIAMSIIDFIKRVIECPNVEASSELDSHPCYQISKHAFSESKRTCPCPLRPVNKDLEKGDKISLILIGYNFGMSTKNLKGIFVSDDLKTKVERVKTKTSSRAQVNWENVTNYLLKDKSTLVIATNIIMCRTSSKSSFKKSRYEVEAICRHYIEELLDHLYPKATLVVYDKDAQKFLNKKYNMNLSPNSYNKINNRLIIYIRRTQGSIIYKNIFQEEQLCEIRKFHNDFK